MPEVNVPKKLELFSDFWVWKSERSCIRSKAQLFQRRHGRVKLGQARRISACSYSAARRYPVSTKTVAHRRMMSSCVAVSVASDARPELGPAPGVEDLVASHRQTDLRAEQHTCH